MSDPLSGLSPDIVQAVLVAARKAGIEVPQASSVPDAPTLRMENGWRRLGMDLGAILRGRDVFLRANELGTVCRRTGKWVRFTPRNFAGWVEEFVCFTWKGEKTSLLAEHAAMMMEQFTFREQVRVLKAIHLIRLPVMREGGKLEFLEPGYDERTESFTVETLKYDMTWSADRGRDFLRGAHIHFPWQRSDAEEAALVGPDGEKPEPLLERNRSYSVHIGAMLGVYCSQMFPPGVLRPMIPYTSNQQGSGKSILVQMALAPVHDVQGAGKMPRNDEEMEKELDATLLAGHGFVFLDDVGQALFSPPLNKFVTAAKKSFRLLGTPDFVTVENRTQVFATTNHIRGSRDLARRALLVELFYAGDLSKRRFDRVWAPEELSRPEVRGDFLAALCSLVRAWAESPQEMLDVAQRNIVPLPSFESWSTTIASMLLVNGYSNPLLPPLVPMDEDEDQVRELLIAAASKQEGNCTLDREKLVEIAWEKELLEDVIGSRTEKGIDSKASKRFGLRLKAWRGRELVDEKGRRFRFAHKRQKHGATYPLVFLS